MTWAAHVLRVPMDWNEDEFDDEQGYAPAWPIEQCTHWQFWQSKADFTPVSPVFATPEDMASYLLENRQRRWFEEWVWAANGDYNTLLEWIKKELSISRAASRTTHESGHRSDASGALIIW